MMCLLKKKEKEKEKRLLFFFLLVTLHRAYNFADSSTPVPQLRGTTQIIAPANISVLNDVFAWFIVPLIAVVRF
jgi:hypothetical protein